MGKGLIAEDGEDEGAKKAKAKMLKKATGGRGVAFTAAKETGKGEADDDNDDDEDSEDGDFEAGLIAAVFARTPHDAYLRARQMQPRTLLRVQFSLRRAPCALGTGAWLCAAGSLQETLWLCVEGRRQNADDCCADVAQTVLSACARACAGEEPDSDEESEEDSGVSKRC